MKKKPFLEHLEELRWLLLKVGITLSFATVALFFLSPRLLQVMTWPLQVITGGPEPVALRTLRPVSGVLIGVKLAFLSALVVSFPLLSLFAAQFFLPALKPREKRWLAPLFVAAGGLFALGALFCYFVALPLALKFLWSYGEKMGLANDWTIEYYVSFATGLLLVFGLVFELPIVVLGLVRASILTPEFLKQKRPYAIVAILIVAAVVTPPDVVSQILVAVPMLLLYEVSVAIAKWFRVKESLRELSYK